MIPEEIISQLVDEAIEIESQTKKNEEGRYIVNVLTLTFHQNGMCAWDSMWCLVDTHWTKFSLMRPKRSYIQTSPYYRNMTLFWKIYCL